MKKSILAIVMTGLLFSLTSCLPEFPDLMVTTEEYQEKTKALLEEKYGEKFEIVCSAGDEATAYPVANPDLLFMAKRNFKSSIVDDTYIQEIVGLQYKKLAEEVLKDFKYDYYLDVDFEFTYDPIDAKQDVTIKEFKKVFTEKVKPYYNWYVSKKALELDNKALYEWINKVAAIPEQDNALVRMFFVDYDQMVLVKQHYENYSYRTGQFQTDTGGILRVQQCVEDNSFIISFKRFNELMNGE
ncbi:MAG: hypothetical protein IKN85_14785 [Oscillospiraceae bacterium]|nr:hypothetical protein [Oscillospiraceae bacterium]MBR3537085.1 hypothetical protein [Oscillospiraceae bacterium]